MSCVNRAQGGLGRPGLFTGSADERALLVAAPQQLDIYDVAQPNPAPRLEESLQDGCDAHSVLNGVPE